jgi:3-phenylpropionate/trans-cinnamate dioxygenase ferredoxin component
LKELVRAHSSTFEDGKPIRFSYPPFDVLVVRSGDLFFAIEDACNHSGASLATGTVCRTEISCPLHGYIFDLATGALLRPKGLCGPQRTFTVEQDGDDIVVLENTAVQLRSSIVMPRSRP